MIKEKVIICDFCDKQVSQDKCNLCGGDLCGNCAKYLRLKCDEGTDHTRIHFNRYIYYCNSCFNLIKEIKDEFWSKEMKEQLEKIMTDFVKKAMIIEKLEDKKKDGKEE